MITAANSQLLASQEALAELSDRPLNGLHALALKEIMSAVEGRLQRLQEVQTGLMEDVEAGEKTQEEADNEWQEVLADELELTEHDPLPREALENIQISAGALMNLDWLIQDQNDENTDTDQSN